MNKTTEVLGVQTANAAAKPSNSLAATPPGSPGPAATEIPPRHRPLAFVAFVTRKAQAHEGFGGGAGAAILFALFAHVAAASAQRYRSTLAPREAWWIYRWPVAEDAVVVLWLSQWNRAGPRARSR